LPYSFDIDNQLQVAHGHHWALLEKAFKQLKLSRINMVRLFLRIRTVSFASRGITLTRIFLDVLGKRRFATTTIPSPGLMPAESSVAFGALVESIKNSGMVSFLNGNRNIESRDLFTARPRADNELMWHLGLNSDHLMGDAALNVDFTRLGKESETSFQEGQIQDNFFMYLLHTLWIFRSLQRRGPISNRRRPSSISRTRASIVQTSKPDGTSTVAPMDLEINSDCRTGPPTTLDWEVLYQAVERAYASIRLSKSCRCVCRDWPIRMD
jgi:hypothetical protein